MRVHPPLLKGSLSWACLPQMLRASGTVDIVEGSWITDSFAYEMGGALALGAGVMTLANGSSIINS